MMFLFGVICFGWIIAPNRQADFCRNSVRESAVCVPDAAFRFRAACRLYSRFRRLRHIFSIPVWNNHIKKVFFVFAAISLRMQPLHTFYRRG
ncbi:hypothetical protein NEILACOT_03258 [Neisseria lactamica ATCC 23970]|uniref:Uncharacterized protein n=1 Tax=Neisseria lactamica ATCC 23970 TaxID=546265 RepID=D0W6W7_NEILA|nr:hypothetical protein NEILACOT_03258 [Neisseria lactamica ATCC 23970]